MAVGSREEVVTVEDGAWPILVIRFPVVVSAETVQSMLRAIERAYARKQRFAVIVDTTPVSKFPAAPARQVLSDWVADGQRAERERAWTVTTVVVLESGPLRALTAAINLMRKPVSPQHWTATFGDAVEWARRCLIAEGAKLPPGAEALYEETRGARNAGHAG
jgi:hypothetical protein